MGRLMPMIDWVYPARIDRTTTRKAGPFVDGDTFIVERLLNQQGLKEGEIRVRLLEVDTPEVTGETKVAGLEAAAWTKKWLESVEDLMVEGSWPLAIQTIKKDSFGRHLAYVWDVTTGECLNDAIVEAGFSDYVSALEQLTAGGKA